MAPKLALRQNDTVFSRAPALKHLRGRLSDADALEQLVSCHDCPGVETKANEMQTIDDEPFEVTRSVDKLNCVVLCGDGLRKRATIHTTLVLGHRRARSSWTINYYQNVLSNFALMSFRPRDD
jgi:hypothetical protein